jgi:hypothetical protein
VLLTHTNSNSFSSTFQVSGTVSEINNDKKQITINMEVADVEISNGKKTEKIHNASYTLKAGKEILVDIKKGDNVICDVEPGDRCTKIKKIIGK